MHEDHLEGKLKSMEESHWTRASVFVLIGIVASLYWGELLRLDLVALTLFRGRHHHYWEATRQEPPSGHSTMPPPPPAKHFTTTNMTTLAEHKNLSPKKRYLNRNLCLLPVVHPCLFMWCDCCILASTQLMLLLQQVHEVDFVDSAVFQNFHWCFKITSRTFAY